MAKYTAQGVEQKGELNAEIKAVDKKADMLLVIMLGVVIVLFVGFMTLLVMVAQMMLTFPHR